MVRAIVLVVALGGCNIVLDLEPLDVEPAVDNYNRCAPGGYEDPLRYKFLDTMYFDSPSWEDARTACQRWGYDLAVFNDVHEMGMADPSFPYWIGVYQDPGSAWTTVDGCEALAMPPTPVALGGDLMCGALTQPLSPEGTNCDGHIIYQGEPRDMQGVWCETPRPTTSACLPREPGSESYELSPHVMTYADAKAFCAGKRMHVFEPSSFDEWKLLSNLVTEPVWVGTQFTGTWKSETTCPTVFSWTELGPKFVGDPFPNCAATVTSVLDEGGVRLDGMAIARCDEQRLALCESD